MRPANLVPYDEQFETSGSSAELNQLVRRVGDGDSDALDLLLTRYRPYLAVVAQRSLRQLYQGRFDGSDVVQQTCIDAFNGIQSLHGTKACEFNAWITRILRRNIATLMREHTAQKRDTRRERSAPSDDGDASLQWIDCQSPRMGPVTRIIRGEAALMLAQALLQLSDAERTAVQMRFLEGCKLAEIAGYLEVTPSVAARLIERGLEDLRRQLPPEFAELK